MLPQDILKKLPLGLNCRKNSSPRRKADVPSCLEAFDPQAPGQAWTCSLALFLEKQGMGCH